MVDLLSKTIVLWPRMADFLTKKLVLLSEIVNPLTSFWLCNYIWLTFYPGNKFFCHGWLTSHPPFYRKNQFFCSGWLTSYLINWFCCPGQLTLCPLMMWLSSWAGQLAGHRSCLSSELHHSSPTQQGNVRNFQKYLIFVIEL